MSVSGTERFKHINKQLNSNRLQIIKITSLTPNEMAYTLDFFELEGKTGSVAVNSFFFGTS
jgi:hypothetical protein